MDLKRDTAQGLKLLKLSAQQGDADAYLMLGMAYMNLKEAPRDVVQADMWLRLAAGRGDPLASGQRSKLESHMTRDQIAKAEALAAAWNPKAAQGASADKNKK
jgi:TPR repeat protein